MTPPGGELRVYPDRLADNARHLLDTIGPNLIAVIKGDGYGLGLSTCARAFAHAGISAIAVADLAEAVEVRAAGVSTRLLILQAQEIAALPGLSLEWVVGQIELDRLLKDPPNGEATVLVHLDIDLGVGRGGIAPQHADAALDALQTLPNARVVGLCAHLPSGPDQEQFRQAIGLLEHLRARTPNAAIHLGGSDALAWHQLAGHAWLRIGRPLYGIAPRAIATPELDGLDAAWAWVADATPFTAPGSGGYTADHRPPGTPLRINAGYAHGLPCQAAGRWPLLVNGRRYRIRHVFMLTSVAYPCDNDPSALAGEALLSGQTADQIPVRDISGSLGVPTTAILMAPRARTVVAAL